MALAINSLAASVWIIAGHPSLKMIPCRKHSVTVAVDLSVHANSLHVAVARSIAPRM